MNTSHHSHHGPAHDSHAHHHGGADQAAVFEKPAEPARASAQGAIPARGTVEYTCPMHPEIVRDAPGSCPICGMALEPRVPTLDAGPDPELVDMARRFWVAAALTLPLLIVTMSEMVWLAIVT